MEQFSNFIHLRVHSSFSLLEGALQIQDILKGCQADGMPAVAITDTNNLFGALEFSEKASSFGVQPIIGYQQDIIYEEDPRTGVKIAPLVLLAQNETGYRNILKICSNGYLDKNEHAPAISINALAEFSDGVICLTGGANGPIGALIQTGNLTKASEMLLALSNIFPDCLYVELQRHKNLETGDQPSEERLTEAQFIQMAYENKLPLVATNDVYFPKKDMYEAHDALLCIKDGSYVDQQSARRQLTPEHYFKSQSEMCELFSDLPEAISNTVEIAQRCAFKVRTHAPILPKFADDEVVELRRHAHRGLDERLKIIEHAVSIEEYKERLDFELGVIERMGFPGYFLIVADFIKWAKDNDIPVGPGRGSGAGSLVAYALTITDLDPLRYSLLFERFLNPDRVSMPDFDIDFCMDRREEVIRYVQGKYGNDRVAQIITFGALLSKAAVRDIGRVLQMPYGQVDRLAKLIPVEGVKPVSIAQAKLDEPRINQEAAQEEVVARMLDYAERVEGLLRNASTHAAGIVIADRALDQLVPLYKDPRSDMPVTQFSMKWAEAAGLVKFDFLGLKTLTVIKNALDLLKKRGVDVDIDRISLEDEKTYELYTSANTVAVFQVESAGMRDALRQMKPTGIEDIIALVALYRPGPMENIPKFCKVKNGLEERESLHPSIDHILDETQGIIVYQEQVMQIAQEMAGYSLGGADLLRRAMGKKIQEAMDAEKPKFLNGASENNVDQDKAQEVWDLLNKFANYGFNKSHAAAYAIVSYQTGWLKANYPVEFMAAVMNCDIHLTDKLNIYHQETKRMKIEIVPPCINRSMADFDVIDSKIHYALGALKGVGADAMQTLVLARETGGEFLDLLDFAQRVELKRLGKRGLEMLARSGAFDQITQNRAMVLSNIERLVAYSASIHAEKQSAQTNLFGGAGENLPGIKLLETEGWQAPERMTEEHQAIGFYLSGHPLDDYFPTLKRQRVMTLEELLIKLQTGPVVGRVAGTVASKQERKSARGNMFAFIQLSDPTGLFEVTVFSDMLDKYRDLLEPGKNIVLNIEASNEDEQLRLRAHSAQLVDKVIENASAKGVRIFVNSNEALSPLVARLGKPSVESRSSSPVNLVIMDQALPGEVEITLKGGFTVTPQVKSAIKHIDGVIKVEEF